MDSLHQAQPPLNDAEQRRQPEDEAAADARDVCIEKQEDAAVSSHAIVLATQSSRNSRDPTSDQKILALLRQSILPFSDRLDPFAALPVHLDRLQEHLVSFYLLHYPQVTYGFSPLLRPHPTATNFSIALTTPACFQVILARSALYRLSLSKYVGDKEKHALQVVMMRHKGEALRLIRVLSAKSSPTRKDDLIASIISLGNLDRRTGSKDAAGMHFMAVRRILKATGGPLAVRSLLLSRVMCFFECIYVTSPESYIWDEEDLKRLLPEMNEFFARIWIFWKQSSALAQARSKSPYFASYSYPSSNESQPLPYLQPSSALRTILLRPAGPAEPSDENPILPKHRMELIFQVTCLLTLAAIILDYSQLPPSARTSTFTSSSYTQESGSSTTPFHPSISSSSTTTSTNIRRRRLAPKPPPSTSSHGTSSSSGAEPSSFPFPSTSTATTVVPPSASASASNTTSIPTPTKVKPSKHPNQHAHSHAYAHTHAHAQAPQSPVANPTPLDSYLLNLHQTISSLTPSILTQPAHNVMWQIQITDHSEAHSRRIWKAAAYAWVLKHVGWRVQTEVGGWLARWIDGFSVDWYGLDGAGPRGSEEGSRERSEEGMGSGVAGKQGEGVYEQGEGKKREREKGNWLYEKGKVEGEKEKPLKLDAFHFSYAA